MSRTIAPGAGPEPLPPPMPGADPGVCSAPAQRVGRRFVWLYAAAFTGTCLVLVAPLLVTLALKINSLVGPERAPEGLALVTGVGGLVAMVANPFFGTVASGVEGFRPIRSRRPTGSSSGQCCRASDSLTSTTGTDSRVSESLKSRPALTRIPIAWKYPGVTI